MGLNYTERAIEVLYEQGVPREQIACRLGISARTVRNIEQRLFEDEGRVRRQEKRFRAQSRRLGKLVRQAGGHR